MAPYITIASGQGVSSAFVLERLAGALVVQVPSHATLGRVQVQFAAASNGPFAPMLDPGALFAGVWSGAGPGWGAVVLPPSTIARIACGSTSDVATFGLFPQNYR